MDHGHKLSQPGVEYHYADTGYVMLGEIIEWASGMSLPEAASRLIDYPRLGMASPHFEALEHAPPGERWAHRYVGDQDITDANPSLDLYGGGMASAMADLIRFIRPLVKGEVFSKPTTLPAALMIPPTDHAPGEFPESRLLAPEKFGARTCLGQSGF